MNTQVKLFSDPVHGFIAVPRDGILPLIQTPEVQRLRRIRQLGVGNMVYPGAEHTRFGHALGAMALMHDALHTLVDKGTPISPEEERAALAAALLHDIGHSPFSHSLEHELVDDFHHEAMSRSLILALNERFDGMLDLALAIFDGTYERPFFHQLVSSQLDMDRLDYLRRDSFYTGVVEGRVGSQRIIKTMQVHPTAGGPNSKIVIETKGIYAVENFLIARRLMYWQVYLHRTVLAGDHVLRAILLRARQLLREGQEDYLKGGSSALLFFLRQVIHSSQVNEPEIRARFCTLDDTDVIHSLKQWIFSPDPVLSDLSRRFIERDFVRTSFLSEHLSPEQVDDWRARIAEWLLAKGLSSPKHVEENVDYYFAISSSRHATYERVENSISILDEAGAIRELSVTTDTEAIQALSQFVEKPYVCFPKEVPSPNEKIH